MEISAERLKELELTEMKMRALEAGGVDNWEWYGESLTKYHEMIKRQEKVEKAFDEICEILCEGVHEPSERGAGFGFHEKSTEQALEVFKRTIKELESKS